ncbi:putative phage tail assembly chaperone [Vibrio sp. Vb2853]|uniref:putative phage tail assembly chaperone n=1 Tax=Vibrio TaxID=662 RepID=UPI00102D7012|nr:MULTISPECIES: putative phage tail assembly chaperone [Vibrio]MDW1615053.1 putative phage tail assembly chaperone [Vibrio sp. Vb2881]MDW1619769.1 putative phage tail assembly chaperone [Vibrio sp. Vb2864]MDW1691903.1 putative phage tail assembly chaperone [Vibrio sp. Vb2853]MDW1710613.1 putative phage tail assembly chaperone [Vibrio sp. Vb2865]MDW1715734.1 putative phage tail assembly chaperone [Vibrio sp. Vb2873]
MSKQQVTLTVKGKEIRFEPSLEAFNKFTNETLPFDKVAPATNYLRRIVVKEDKPLLDEALKLPGAVMQLAGLINSEFQGDLEIEVKN